MSKLLKAVKTAIARAVAAAKTLYRKYPARCNSYILAALVAAGSALGLVVDPESAGQVIAIVIPILLGGEATHRLVSPAK
jgi:hypothetical protein